MFDQLKKIQFIVQASIALSSLFALFVASPSQAQVQRSFVNPSFELPFSGPRATALNPFFNTMQWITVDQGEILGWNTTHPLVSNGCPAGSGALTSPYDCRPIELWANSFTGVVPAHGRVLAELNSYQNSKLFQSACLATGEQFAFNFAHRGRQGVDRMAFEIGSPPVAMMDVSTGTGGTGTINLSSAGGISATAISGGWTRYAGTYTYAGPSGLQDIGFAAISTAGASLGAGNLVDDINIQLKPFVELERASTSTQERLSSGLPRLRIVGLVPTGGLSVSLTVSGTASFGSDFDYSGSTTLLNISGNSASLTFTIPEGNYGIEQGNSLITLPLRIIDDLNIEADETIVLSLPANSPTAQLIVAGTTNCGDPGITSVTHTVLNDDNRVDVSKAVGSPASTGFGRFEVPYAITIGNAQIGNPTLFNVQANDNLRLTFPLVAGGSPSISIKAGSYTITPQGSASCSAPGQPFNGVTSTALLSGTDDLAGGASCVIRFVVELDYGGNAIPTSDLNNSAYASASYEDSLPNPGYTFVNGFPVQPIGASAVDTSSNSPSAPPGSAPGTVPPVPLLPTVANGDAPSATPVQLPPQADIRATTTLPTSLVAGQSLTVTGTCTNFGPSAATQASCVLSGLPAGASQSCTPSSTVTNLAVGETIVCTSTFSVPSSGLLRITTTSATSTTDPVSSNDTDTKDASITPLADMRAVASGFDPNPPAGSTATGTFTCTNFGPSTASNASCIVSSVPAGATVSCSPSQTVGLLAVGASITCTVSYVVPTSGGVTISGLASSTTADPNLTNNSAQFSANVLERADMLAVTNVPATVDAGTTITVTGSCSNLGPSNATAVTCQLSGLPAGATQSCTPSPIPNPFGLTDSVICSSTFVVPASGPLTISTTTSNSTYDPISGNNTDTKTIQVTPQADISVGFSGFPTNPPAGTTVTGVVACTNNGPSTGVNAVCSVSGLPAGATVSCAPSVPVGSLTIGATIQCSVSFVTPASGTVNLSATTSSTTADPNLGNNLSTLNLSVVSRADMTAVTDLPSTKNAGQSITVSGTCTNAGPSAAAQATCTLTGLPSVATQSCTPTPPISSLALGQSIVCTSTFLVPASGSLIITTTAGSSTSDPVPANNSDTKTSSVNPQSDLQVITNGFNLTPVAGTTETGTVTCRNNGPSIAQNVSCTVNSLPSGANISCSPASTAESLGVGETIVCTVTYTVPVTGGVTISAVASSATADPLITNNATQVSANVVPLADMLSTTTAPATVNAGQSVTVSGICSNAGPSDATSPTCFLSGLPPGATQSCVPTPAPSPLSLTQTITCTSTFIAPASGTLSISTTAGSLTADSNNANNTQTSVVQIVPQSDMVITFSGFPTNPPAGSSVVGNISCTNQGPSTAVNATCVVTGLPAGSVLACSPTPPAAILAVGASISCTVSFIAPSDGSPVALNGSTQSDTSDPVTSNNTAQLNLSISPRADMQARLIDLSSTVFAGSTVTGTAVCTNNGPSAAVSASCQITGLPAGASVSCTPTPAANPLPVGSSISCAFSFIAPSSGSPTIIATTGSSTSDPAAGNNTASQVVAVTPLADMQASLTGFPLNATAGAPISGQLICTNNGPSFAVSPSCVPSGLPAGAVVICTPNPVPSALAVGSTITCNITFTMPANNRLNLVGTASSLTADPVMGNNMATFQGNSIRAISDQSSQLTNGVSGGTAVPNVLANDTINGAPVTLSQVTLTQIATSHPGIQLDLVTGAVRVSPGTPVGSYTLQYQICTSATPVACDTTTVAIIVNSANIDAVDDPQIYNGPNGSSTNLLSNDTLDSRPLNANEVNLTLVDSGGLGPLTLDTVGNLVIPPNAPLGSYTVRYRICEKLNPTNCDEAVVQVTNQGKVTGSVWFDVGSSSDSTGSQNRLRDQGEPGLASWIVEVVFPEGHPQSGQTASTVAGAPAVALTNDTGSYEIPGLPPGEYLLRFRTPGSVGQSAAFGTPVNGESANPQMGSTVDLASRTLKITIGRGTALAEQSLPVDPSGVVYDSVTRQPITNVVVALIGPDGLPVPDRFLMPGQQNQQVVQSGPAAGSYRFDLLPGAPVGTYTLQMRPNGDYVASTLIPPNPSILTPPSGCTAGTPAKICVVQSQSAAPSVDQSSNYYLRMFIDVSNGVDILRNHLPLDPVRRPLLMIIKSADRRTAEVGDAVRYVIRIRNNGNAPALGTQVLDSLPAGFSYLSQTAAYVQPGTSVQTILPDPVGGSGPNLVFTLPGRVEVGQEAVLIYRTRVGVGSLAGDGTNRARARIGALSSNESRHKMILSEGVFSSAVCIAGKVYVDCNGNQIQDSEELGIPSVRLYLQDGTSLMTDEEGKFSFCGLSPRTNVLKVDPITLPKASKLVTSSNRNLGDAGSLLLDAKKGELHRADFVEGSCTPAIIKNVKERRLRPVCVSQLLSSCGRAP